MKNGKQFKMEAISEGSQRPTETAFQWMDGWNIRFESEISSATTLPK